MDIHEFLNEIDSRKGYLTSLADNLPRLALSVSDFTTDLQDAIDEQNTINKIVTVAKMARGDKVVEAFAMKQVLVLPPEIDEGWQKDHPYDEGHRSEEAKDLDDRIPLIEEWLRDPDTPVTATMTKSELASFSKTAMKFFVDEEGRLYRRASEGSSQHKLYVPKDKRMWMLSAGHNALGHKGMFATKALIEKRFWWPHLDEDVDWFVKSCQPCQDRRLDMLRIPPVITHTPSLFQKIHIDVFKISPASNGYKNVVHRRCALSNWSEAKLSTVIW